MYSLKDIVRINDILSEYHGVKCVVVKKGNKSYDVETLNTAKLEAAVELARKKLEDHLKGIKKRQKHIDYLESTMNIKWIENPPY